MVAGAFLFLFSLMLTTVLFPGIVEEMRAMQAQLLRDAGHTEAEVSAAVVYQGTAPAGQGVTIQLGAFGLGGEGGNVESIEASHDGIHGSAAQELSVS